MRSKRSKEWHARRAMRRNDALLGASENRPWVRPILGFDWKTILESYKHHTVFDSKVMGSKCMVKTTIRPNLFNGVSLDYEVIDEFAIYKEPEE